MLGGGPRGTTEENIQARVRGAVLMALSNQRGSILLSTGNKSELAVGYCTLYGDMCGGLARHQRRAEDCSSTGSRATSTASGTIIPESTLDEAAERRAAARPEGHRLAAAVRHPRPDHRCVRRAPLDADAIVRLGFDPAVVADVIRRIDSSEYKRRQAAPGIKISSKAFGVGRRYPIAAEYRY